MVEVPSIQPSPPWARTCSSSSVRKQLAGIERVPLGVLLEVPLQPDLVRLGQVVAAPSQRLVAPARRARGLLTAWHPPPAPAAAAGCRPGAGGAARPSGRSRSRECADQRAAERGSGRSRARLDRTSADHPALTPVAVESDTDRKKSDFPAKSVCWEPNLASSSGLSMKAGSGGSEHRRSTILPPDFQPRSIRWVSPKIVCMAPEDKAARFLGQNTQIVDQRRLTDARLATNQHRPALARNIRSKCSRKSPARAHGPPAAAAPVVAVVSASGTCTSMPWCADAGATLPSQSDSERSRSLDPLGGLPASRRLHPARSLVSSKSGRYGFSKRQPSASSCRILRDASDAVEQKEQ